MNRVKQVGEAGSSRGGLAGESLVFIHDDNALGRPAELNRATIQSVLAISRFAIVQDLVSRRLADVHNSFAGEVSGSDLRGE